jgi:hypothetical protein
MSIVTRSNRLIDSSCHYCRNLCNKLLNSGKYIENFGKDIFSSQRHRKLTEQDQESFPFNIQSFHYNNYYASIFSVFAKIIG